MSNRRLARSLTQAAFHTGESALHSAVTIAARLPMFAQCMVSPNAMQEVGRAYSEKVAAGWEGAMAAGLAWQQLMMQAALRGTTPAGLAHGVVKVMGKAANPARKRVKANATRLGGRFSG
jgi:hypothetical protein